VKAVLLKRIKILVQQAARPGPTGFQPFNCQAHSFQVGLYCSLLGRRLSGLLSHQEGAARMTGGKSKPVIERSKAAFKVVEKLCCSVSGSLAR